MDLPSAGYYDWHPLVIPARPIAVAGAPGARVESTARLLSILTGLPLVSVDRAVEHALGASIARIVAAPGGPRRRATAEAAALKQALVRHNPPIVALGETTLLDPGSRWLVQSRARVVHLRLGFEAARAALADAGNEPDPGVLRARCAELGEVLERVADLTVEVEGRHPSEVARELVDRLALEPPPA